MCVKTNIRHLPDTFLAHATPDHCPGCRALVSGGRAQGHTEEHGTRVKGQLKKTEVCKARLQAAAVRVADAPARRAARRIRFAGDQVVGSAGVQEDLATEAQAASIAPTRGPALHAALEASGKQRGGQLFSHRVGGLQLCSCSTRLGEWRSDQLFQHGSETPEC